MMPPLPSGKLDQEASTPWLPGELSFSELLHQRRLLLSARLLRASRRLWEHPEAARLYPCLLFRAHCVSRAAVPLMEAAAARLQSMRNDPIAPGLIEFLHRFIPEETGHDEWLLEDLEVLGRSRQDVLAHTPPPALAALVGAQYYWIAHHHPVSVLGLFFMMETGTPLLEQVEDLIRRTGLPRTAFRSFLRHAVLDLKHGNDIEQVIDTLPFTSAHRSTIGVSLAHSAQYLALSTEEIVDLYEIRKNGEVQLY